MNYFIDKMNFLFSPAVHASHILIILYIRKTTIATLMGSLEKKYRQEYSKHPPKNIKLDS